LNGDGNDLQFKDMTFTYFMSQGVPG